MFLPVAGELAAKMILPPSGDQWTPWQPKPLGSNWDPPHGRPWTWISRRPLPSAWMTQIEPRTSAGAWGEEGMWFPPGEPSPPVPLSGRRPGGGVRRGEGGVGFAAQERTPALGLGR